MDKENNNVRGENFHTELVKSASASGHAFPCASAM